MKNYKNLTRDEFLELSTEEIAEIVKQEGRPNVGVFLPDGARRSAMIFMGFHPEDEGFEKKYIEIEGKQFLENIKIMFQHGLNTLIIPSLKHENFNRDKKTIDAIMQKAIRSMLIGNDWLEFYKEYNVKVKVYGDFDYVKSKGYPEVMDWAKDIEERTKNNTQHRIFHGIACSNRYEHPRLMDLAVDYYIKHKRKPNDEEKIQLYYKDDVSDVDFLIRATAIRDSDLQPPIISGKKTQMYFLVAPDYMSFSTKLYRKILYDLIYCRTSVFGKKMYKNSELQKIDIDFIRTYYVLNKSKVMGLGEKIGPFWVPQIKIRMPKIE